jgi:hypothetical protein
MLTSCDSIFTVDIMFYLFEARLLYTNMFNALVYSFPNVAFSVLLRCSHYPYRLNFLVFWVIYIYFWYLFVPCFCLELG